MASCSKLPPLSSCAIRSLALASSSTRMCLAWNSSFGASAMRASYSAFSSASVGSAPSVYFLNSSSASALLPTSSSRAFGSPTPSFCFSASWAPGVHADQLVERLFLFLGGQVARRLAGVARLDVQVPDVARNRRAIDHRNGLGRGVDGRVGLGAPGHEQHAERGDGENLRMSHCVLGGESSSGETATMFRAWISRGSIWASAS